MNRAVLVSFGLGLATALYAWTTPERIDRRPDDYVVYMVTAAANDRGGIHAAWSECKRGTYYEKIMHAFRVNDTWSVPENISRDSGDLRWAAITLDTAGRPFVVWSEEGAARLRYVRYVGDTWTLPRLVASTSGIEPQLVTDSHNRIHLVFEGFAGEHAIWYSQFDWAEDTWTSPEAIARADDDIGKSSLAVDNFDHLHAAWMNWARRGIDYSFKNQDGWQLPETVPDPSPMMWSRLPSLAVGATGIPHIVWLDGDVYHSDRASGVWSQPTVVCSTRTYRPLTALSDEGVVQAVWGGESGLWYSHGDDGRWTSPLLLSDSFSEPLRLWKWQGDLHLVWTDVRFRAHYMRHTPAGLDDRPTPGPRRIGAETVTVQGSQVFLSLDATAGESLWIAVFDQLGRCVGSRVYCAVASGYVRVVVGERRLRSGVYWVRYESAQHRGTAKVVVLE